MREKSQTSKHRRIQGAKLSKLQYQNEKLTKNPNAGINMPPLLYVEPTLLDFSHQCVHIV